MASGSPTASPLSAFQTSVRPSRIERFARIHVVDERTIAARVFRQLVTPSGAKITHRASDLAGYAGVPESTMLPILDKLAAQRITGR